MHSVMHSGTCIAESVSMATYTNDKTISNAAAEQKFIEVLKSFDNAMLISGVSGHQGVGMHARPMSIAEVDKDGVLWFLTGKDTEKAFEISRESEAMAVMQGNVRYLSVSGNAEIVEDRAKVHALWKEPMRAWFDGKDDPRIVLIALRPSAAEYWDNTGISGVRFALRYAKAMLTGEELRQPPGNTATHGKVQL